jgi:hypothetical protein
VSGSSNKDISTSIAKIGKAKDGASGLPECGYDLAMI